jgi:transposase
MTFKEYNQHQTFLLPPNFGEFLGESHLAIILNELVDELDTTKLIESYKNEKGGSSAYHPVMILKILIYAYSNAVFSSRKISKKLREDIAFMFLAGKNTPDFRTISRFRREKGVFIENIFSQIVSKAKEMGFVSFGTCSLDGTKIYANASTSKNKTKSQLEKEIQELMEQAKEIDELEDKLYGDNEDDIDLDLKTKEGREKRKKRIKDREVKIRATLKQVSKPKKSKSIPKLNITDPDSRFMQMKKKDFANGYNIQNITENGFVLSNYVNNSSADQNTLIPTIKKFKDTHQNILQKLLADKGYSTSDNYSFCEENNIDGYIPPQKENIDLSKYIYNEKDDTYTDKEGNVFVFKQHMRRKSGIGKKGKSDFLNRHLYRSIVYENISKTAKKRYLHIDKDWIRHCEKQKKKLSTPQGKEIYKKRRYDVEGVFANIKKNLKFTHFNLRGLERVKTEWNLISIAHNLLKIARS